MKSNKYNFSAITAITLSLATGISHANEPTLFGEANLSIASLDDDNGKSTAVSSHSSRIGIKGSMNTENSLEIVYRFVWQVDITDEAKASDDNIKSREQYIGLKDKSGTLIYHGQIREYKGKMYRVIHEGWRVVLDRNMVMFGENETIIINEDVAYLSSIIYETCEELNQ